MDTRFLQMSPKGEFYDGLQKVSHSLGLTLIQNLRQEENNTFTSVYENNKFIIESYDYPLVVHSINEPHHQDKGWLAKGAYGHSWFFKLNELFLDPWDRFTGIYLENLPFVFSPQAQEQIFSIVDEFEDDALIYKEERFSTPSWLSDIGTVDFSKHWSQIYQNEKPRWELEQPTPTLTENLQRLKLPKSRIVVLGCGSGNDAAYLAQQGHIVTAIDFSPEAISQAKEKYNHIDNLKFIQEDLFQLPHKNHGQFDVILEHTCFCAINPSKRKKLVQLWHKLLVDDGKLIGIFFATPRNHAPPFGSTEWEIERYLKKDFQFLLWERTKSSLKKRLGKELFVLAQKRSK